MNHCFNIEVAKDFGVNQAIFIENLVFWIQKNKASNKNYHDGHYWTYNSQEAFATLFPYWTRCHIRTILDKLKADKVLLVGNYNRIKYDKTLWYTLTDDFIEKYYPTVNNRKNGLHKPIESTATTVGSVGAIPPIPDITQYKQYNPSSSLITNCSDRANKKDDDDDQGSDIVEKEIAPIAEAKTPTVKPSTVKPSMIEDPTVEDQNVVDDILLKIKSIVTNFNVNQLISIVGNLGIAETFNRVKYAVDNWDLLRGMNIIRNKAGLLTNMILYPENYKKETAKAQPPVKNANTNSSQYYDNRVPQRGNFDQREYDDAFYNSLYDNIPVTNCGAV